MTHPLDHLSTREGYVRLFADVAFWRPYVREVCRRHRFTPCEVIRTGIVGTYPVFIVEERWLVKFYGRLLDGERGFMAEQAAAELLRARPVLPTPALLASGALEPPGADWHWPYLIFELLPGVSLGEVWAAISHAERLSIARQMGAWLRALHSLPLPAEGAFETDWGAYLHFLDGQRKGCAGRQRAWGTLPASLCDEIESFLCPTHHFLLPGEAPHLVHADLTADHLLGRLVDGHWETAGIIDFGDARTGSLFYELPALHLQGWGGEKPLLEAFLDAYGYCGPTGTAFAHRAMSASLLHLFNVFDSPACRAVLSRVKSLEELAGVWWGV
ncbi:MAG TPA: hypothetical protein DEQ80_05725 [Anaerolinea thermolimosa]|uniref:Homoserine kinase type II n=1 Tax=Anaerolinea thermolimosa TaxID=229919 RepID=A0A3D1JHU0_9CHLR|nr:phosphotransferase [Anaerolinea thermolimosa]GAP08307.1 putative homoserine kinase type II [Anaerolinea thermolimosa]HCE17338.1 hypothetical protein [Anaerolinea thermolimosa]